MKKIELSVLIALIISIVISNFSVFSKACDGVRREVFRLHILANSDGAQDQELKLKVRDEILKYSPELFSESTNLNGAVERAKQSIDEIIRISQEVIKREGLDYGVSAEVCESFFDTRVYENVTLPAGVYSCLKIKLGKAEGKNWWCVLFPALCIPAAQNKAELGDVLNDVEIDTVTNPIYKPKFAILEFFEKLKNA